MKRWLTKNLGLKMLTLTLSIAIWVFITQRGQSEIPFEVPLEYKNIPKGFEITKRGATTVNIHIQGQEKIVKNLNPRDISVYIDMSKAMEGERIFYISKETIKIPSSLTVNKINPTYVKVTLEKTKTRTVGIKPLITGTPENGYYVRGVRVSPEKVVIEGVESVLKKIAFIKTEPVDVSNKNSTFVSDIPLSYEGTNVKPHIEIVQVTVTIGGK